MSKTILKQIFDGKLYPAEQIKVTDPKYRELSQKRCDVTENFIKSLSESDCIIYGNIEELESQIENMYNYEFFAEGFRIGVALTMEAFQCK